MLQANTGTDFSRMARLECAAEVLEEAGGEIADKSKQEDIYIVVLIYMDTS